MNKPEVKNYLDCFQFLQDVYKYNKHIHPEFSYQLWSHHLNVKSKSYLRFATLGRRKISETLKTKFLDWFQFSESDKKYFILLIEFTQAKNSESKNIFSKKLIEIIKLDSAENPPADLIPEIGDPVLFHIRDLISCVDISHTTESLSRQFKYTLSDMSNLLEKLEHHQLIRKDENNHWFTTQASVKIKDDPNNTNLYTYHKKSLTEAIAQIENKTVLRKFRSLNFVLDESEFNEMNQKAYDFLTILFNEYSATSKAVGKKIYQLNYNLSPRTEII